MTRPSLIGGKRAALESEIYFDNNATTPALPEVIESVTRAMADGYGNPSSVHSAGGRARALIQEAREHVAALLRTSSDHVVFTSGATEANNLVLQSLVGRDFARYRLVTSSVEHSSILSAADYLRSRGVEVIVLPVNAHGLVDLEAMVRAIEPGRTLVSIQWANNETGVIQPIEDLAERARAAGALVHTDAVQAVGKISTNLTLLPIDFLSLSGHKLHGPLGSGALVGPGVCRLQPLTYGGSQEGSLRPGTENVPAIVGLGRAFELRACRFDLVSEQTKRLKERFESRLLEKGLVAGINGGGAPRLPNTANVRFTDIDGEALTIRLDQVGVRCSQSSACTNQKPEPSYVLRATGLSEAEAYASVRFAFSELNTAVEVDSAVDSITMIHASLARFAVA